MKRRNFLKNSAVAGLGIVAVPSLVSLGRMDSQASVLRAGAATANITPLMNVPLDGTIMQIGPAKQVHDELHARCLVLDDGKTKLAFAIVDNTMISSEIHDHAKRLIEEHTGIPSGNVLISATHSHSTPRAITGLKPYSEEHKDYLEYLGVRISEGVRRAVDNLAPAKIGWGSTDNTSHVFNRRWMLKDDIKKENPFGGTSDRIMMNPKREDVEKPAGPVDPEVFVLAVQHADGHPMALLANYGLHYVGGIPGGTVSADYYGAFSKKIRQHFGADTYPYPPFVAMMTNGTSGDVNANNVDAPRPKFEPFERMDLVAEDLARTVMSVYGKLEWKTKVLLSSAFTTLALGVRKPDAERLKWAKVLKMPDGASERLTRPQIYAREALALQHYPAQIDIPLQVFRVGGLAIAAIPNEVFAETGLYIKKETPFLGNTFVIELANAYHGYLPTERQHAGGGYETWPARSSYLEVKADTKIRASVLELLDRIKLN